MKISPPRKINQPEEMSEHSYSHLQRNLQQEGAVDLMFESFNRHTYSNHFTDELINERIAEAPLASL
jgi:hypothetical protein